LMNNQDPKYRNGRLILSSTRLVNWSWIYDEPFVSSFNILLLTTSFVSSLCYGLRIFQESNLEKDLVEIEDDSKVSHIFH
jgi:hypothetical protein